MPDTLRIFLTILDSQQRRVLGMIFFCNLGAAALEVLSLGALLPLIAMLVTPQQQPSPAMLDPLRTVLPFLFTPRSLSGAALLVMLVFTVKTGAALALEWWRTRFVNRGKRQLAGRLFASYLNRSYVDQTRQNSTVLLHHINTLPATFQTTALMLLGIINTTLILGGMFSFLLWLDPWVFIILGVTLTGAATIFIRWSNHHLEKLGGEILQRGGVMDMAVAHGLGGIKESRILGREDYFLGRYDSEARIVEKQDSLYSVLSQVPRQLLELVTIATVLIVVLLMMEQGNSGPEIVLKISVFGVAAFRLLPAITTLVNSVSYLSYGQAGLTQLARDLQTEPPRRDGAPAPLPDPLPFTREITLENLSYAYPGSTRMVLQGLHLRIPKNGQIGIIGPSGVGKTTTVDLLLGLLTPAAGQICVDGSPIQENLPRWQQNLGYIPQEIYLADLSLRENIAFGIPPDQIQDPQVWQALRQAQLDGFVQALPAGLDTMIGERGIQLSGGQRQRVGIARALYHQPEVLVMDEATAALDNQTEEELLQALSAMNNRITRVIIAHRLTTVRDCDPIYLLRDGRVAASGTWEELRENHSDFRHFAPEPEPGHGRPGVHH